MKSPNERISGLEDAVEQLQRDLLNSIGAAGFALHKALEGLMDQKRLSYIEKRLIWEDVMKEYSESLYSSPDLWRRVEYRLADIAKGSHRR
ncbi:hypothetical protein [uncultured Parasphingopyxis sp.]|uniref:hypothetical protein n=1 Tax=uncultured Parasphingopyxis sp. TaxID=1547918 RepID=UPI002611A140|nr:hypothetical protein [uncultured Parasphingopyxis sp.]